jgi:hypothetical protein
MENDTGWRFERKRHLPDIVPWRIFDTVNVIDLKFRTNYIFCDHTDNLHGATITNLYRPRLIDTQNEFQINRMWVNVTGHPSDAERLAAHSVLSLWIGDKRYAHVPLLDIYRPRLKPHDRDVSNESGRCMDFTAAPLLVPPNMSVYATLDLSVDCYATILQFVLDGLMARTIS